VLGLLDTSAVSATFKSAKRRVSGATGGRSGSKLSRPKHEETSKSSEREAKKSHGKLRQTSTGCKRLRRSVSAEKQVAELSADVDELAESEHKTSRSAPDLLENQVTHVATGRLPSSSQRRGTQRVTRCNSDLRLADSASSQQSQPVDSSDASETVTPADVCAETN